MKNCAEKSGNIIIKNIKEFLLQNQQWHSTDCNLELYTVLLWYEIHGVYRYL